MIPNQRSLPVYVNNVLKLNSCTYRSGNLTNIVAVTKLLEYMPFKVNGGMMMSPDFSCVIVYTDHKDIDQWLELHQEYAVRHWINPKDPDNITALLGFSPRKARGRPSKLRAEEMRKENFIMAQHIMTAINEGKQGNQIAKEFGISAPRVSQIKKQWSEGFYVDMMETV